MSRREVAFFSAVLVAMGMGWGLTMPLTKIAVSTGYGPFGLLLWQQVLGAVLMAMVCTWRRLPLRRDLPALRTYLVIALVGAVLPNSLSYTAAVHLPSGIMSLLLSAIPMFAFAIALALKSDRFAWRRFGGLCFGLIGVGIIVAPSVDLGAAVPVLWAVAYLLVCLCYAFEGNYVSKWGVADLSPFQLMLGASLVGMMLVAPMMVTSGQTLPPVWPLPVAQQALIGTSVVHVLVYATYVWLVGRAGAVFAVQVSYLVTGFGLFWAWFLLGEAVSSMIWLALAAMFTGMYLVQPRAKAVLEEVPMMRDT